MKTNDILYKVSKALSLSTEEIIDIYAQEGYEMSVSHLASLMKREVEDGFEPCSYELLGLFFDGLITFKRGPSPQKTTDDEAIPLSNNLILKKLRIALELKEAEMEIVFGLGEASLSRQELKSLFRKEDHKNFKVCPDALLMAFIEGIDEFYYSGKEI